MIYEYCVMKLSKMRKQTHIGEAFDNFDTFTDDLIKAAKYGYTSKPYVHVLLQENLEKDVQAYVIRETFPVCVLSDFDFVMSSDSKIKTFDILTRRNYEGIIDYSTFCSIIRNSIIEQEYVGMDIVINHAYNKYIYIMEGLQ